MTLKKIALAALLAATAQQTLAADIYPIEPMHTFPSFEFSHMGISVWRGRFDKTGGLITLDRTAKTGTVDVTVETASISFGLDIMDAKAKSEDFFNVAKYPKATYKGTIAFSGDKPSTINGKVTLLGVTKPLELKILSFNCIPHPMNKTDELCGADVTGVMNWGEYGMKWSRYGQGEAGKTTLHIQVEGIKEK